MLTEKGLDIKISNNDVQNCPYIPLQSHIEVNPTIDFVLISKIYNNSFFIEYSLNSINYADLTINFITQDTNQWIDGFPLSEIPNSNAETKILKYNYEKSYPINSYLDVAMVPKNKGWDERLAEDRKYQYF